MGPIILNGGSNVFSDNLPFFDHQIMDQQKIVEQKKKKMVITLQ